MKRGYPFTTGNLNYGYSYEYVPETKSSGGGGTDGRPGPTGPTGPRGPTGLAGPRWLRGERGPKGDQGDKGDQGQPGPRGQTGPQGQPGPRGQTGPQGSQGPQGTQGPTGAAGARGPAGRDGGYAGKGDKGDTGPVGPRGPKGEKGDKGDKGDQGMSGKKGERGLTGPAGAQGPVGPAGAQGPQGNPGLQGNKGDRGPKGERGNTGQQGPTGKEGPQGPVGNTGSTGPAGPTGPSGPKGEKGDTGGIDKTTKRQIVMVDKNFEKIIYEDSSGKAKGKYKTFSIGTGPPHTAPSNGGYGRNLRVVRETEKEKVPLIGFRYPLKIEQDKYIDPAGTLDITELNFDIPSTQRSDHFGMFFSIMFLNETKKAISSVVLTTYYNGVYQAQKMKNIGSITVNSMSYQYYLCNINSDSLSTLTSLNVQLQFKSSTLKNGKMSMKVYEGFIFDGFTNNDYKNANTTTHFTYPHLKEFDKHKFQDAMVGDVLLTGVKRANGTVIPNDALKITTNNLPTEITTFLPFLNTIKDQKLDAHACILLVKGKPDDFTTYHKSSAVKSFDFKKVNKNTEITIHFNNNIAEGVYSYDFTISSDRDDGFDIYLYGDVGKDGYKANTLYRFWESNDNNSGKDFSKTKQVNKNGGYFIRGSGKKVQFKGSFHYHGNKIVNKGKPFSINVDSGAKNLGKTYEFLVQELEQIKNEDIFGKTLKFIIEPDRTSFDLKEDSYVSIFRDSLLAF